MPTKPTGSVIVHSNGYSARVRIGPNERPCFVLAVASESDAEVRAALLSRLTAAMRGKATPADIKTIVEAAASARTEKGLASAREAAAAIASGETTKAASALAPSFAAFAQTWTNGTLHRQYPDHVRAKDSTRDEEVLRRYINPALDGKRVSDIALEDAERLMRTLPAELAPRTRKLIAQCMRKVLSLAVYPGRHIASNPIPREWMPKIPRSANRAKGYLFPSEDAQLLGCALVPLQRRLVYGILAREGLRTSELERLRWRDVDLEHGRVRLDENKTDDPRAWALSPDVVRTLAWWKGQTSGEDSDVVVRFDRANAAWWLRGDQKDPKKHPGDLRRAGVTRPELFERSPSRQPIRVHDLRATFVTVALANGKTEAWVTDRTGHKSSQMVALYARQARQWSELNLGELGPLDALLPEVSGHRVAIDSRRGWDSNPRMTVLQTVA